MSGSEKIVIDKETWGAKELIEVVASRYFELGAEGVYLPSWEVRGKDGNNTSEQLIEFNNHLKTLGMIGTLDNSNPPILSVSSYPEGQHVMRGWHQFVIWLLMGSFMTVVGSSWFEKYGGAGENSQLGSFWLSAIYFTLPILFTLIAGSFLRSMVARKYGVEIGSIVPIVFPIPSPAWPFGIIGTMGQKRIDLIPIPSRKALGLIEMVIPLTLFFFGSFLTILGLGMTSSNPPPLAEAPVIFETNVISGLFASSWLGDELDLRLQWLHPIGIAGIGLAIIGWGLMLPIPGFPGDRALYAILGPSKMKRGEVQTSIFTAMLTVLVIVFFFSDYMPWIFLAAIGAWQRFSPENVPQPLIVNESEELEEQFRNGLISMVMIILIAGFPGSLPSSEMSDFDLGISTDNWIEQIVFEPGSELEIVLGLVPEGVLPVDGWIQMRIEGPSSEDWIIESECSGDSESCKFKGITQSETDEVTIGITPPEGDLGPHILRILVEITGNQIEHEILMFDESYSGPTAPFWKIVGSSDEDLLCITTRIVEKPGNISTSDPFWEIKNETYLTLGENEVCLSGQIGAIQSSIHEDSQGRMMGPVIIFDEDNGTESSWSLAIENTEPILQINENQWFVPDWINGGNSFVVNHAENGSPFCPTSEVIQEVDSSTNWSVTLEDYTPIRIIGDFQGNGSLRFGDGGWVAFCALEDESIFYRIMSGVDVMISPGNLENSIDKSNFTIYNRGLENLSISIELYGDWTGGDVWNLSVPNQIPSGESGEFVIKPIGDADLNRAVWVSADFEGITVHLAARCSLGGCE